MRPKTYRDGGFRFTQTTSYERINRKRRRWEFRILLPTMGGGKEIQRGGGYCASCLGKNESRGMGVEPVRKRRGKSYVGKFHCTVRKFT